MLNGYNEHAFELCAILNLKFTEDTDGMPVGRFRDIYLNADGTEIHLLTRNGGGNRDCWTPECADTCMCPGCIQTKILPQHEQYISDADDDFDNTFAITKFRVPDAYLEFTQSLASGETPQTLEEKTMSSTQRIQNMSPEELRSHPQIGKLLNMLEEAMNQSGVVVMMDSDKTQS